MKKTLPHNLFHVFFRYSLILSIFLSLTACEAPDLPRTSDLRFAVVSDAHLDAFQMPADSVEAQAAKDGRSFLPLDVRARFRRVLQTIQKQNPDFLIITGDLVNFLNAPSVAVLRDEIQRSGLKVFWAPGNHDRILLTNLKMQNNFRDSNQIFYDKWQNCEKDWAVLGGPLSASFSMKGIWFIFLDDSAGYFEEAEIAKASNLLEQNPGHRAFLFFHKPLQMPHETRAAEKQLGPYYGSFMIPGKIDIAPPSPIFPFLERYKNRIEGIFAGHIHAFSEDLWGQAFRQRTLQAAFLQGMYALVDCQEKGACRVVVRKAWK